MSLYDVLICVVVGVYVDLVSEILEICMILEFGFYFSSDLKELRKVFWLLKFGSMKHSSIKHSCWKTLPNHIYGIKSAFLHSYLSFQFNFWFIKYHKFSYFICSNLFLCRITIVLKVFKISILRENSVYLTIKIRSVCKT